MISKAKLKYIHSLKSKKGRVAQGTFIAEGPKVVGDLLSTFQPTMMFATPLWLQDIHNQERLTHLQQMGVPIETVTNDELTKISCQQHPQEVLCVFEMRKSHLAFDPSRQLILALDDIQDPGNLGTIVRIADWFAIPTILCSENTADIYNPKVVQATMGSLARVNVVYLDLENYIRQHASEFPVYGTLLDGKDIYHENLGSHGLIVMGNEGNGISAAIRTFVNKPLYIPNFAKSGNRAESLNVAIATAITCSEFRRRE